MNYQEVIKNIRDLGFSDDSEMEEFGELVPNSINRAITELNLSIAPIIEKYEFDIDAEDGGYVYITMPDIDDNFLDFADTPVLFEQNGSALYSKFSDYEIESNDTVVINADEHKGSFRIFYKIAHETFTGEQLSTEVPLPLKAHHLVPLLAAYYVWLEDEPTKAAQYFNAYEQKAQEVLANSQSSHIRVRVLSGGI